MRSSAGGSFERLRGRLISASAIAVGASLVILASRQLGLLLPLDLALHDAIARSEVTVSRDAERIALVVVRESDIRVYGHPLSDEILAEAIDRILAADPRAVGVDIYRDIPVGMDSQRLQRLFESETRIVGIERVADADRAGTPPSDWLKSDQVGFSDLLLDRDGVVRRAALFLWSEPEEMHVSLALRLALLHLQGDDVALASGDDEGEELQIGAARMHRLRSGDGPYSGLDDRGYQVLLDQKRDARTFPTYSLGDLMAGNVRPEALKDRTVLLGAAASSIEDLFGVTTRAGPQGRSTAHGVEMHAQTVDQLLRQALDREPTVAGVSSRVQAAVLVLVTMGGALGGLLVPSLRWIGIGSLLGVAACVGIEWMLERMGLWLPATPLVLGFMSAGSLGAGIILREERREKASLRDLFSRHVSERVVAELWRHRAQVLQGGRLRGQRATVTVLMADLQGYTKASEKLEPEALLDWLNEFLSSMAEIVDGHGGLVDDYWGDGLKADFGLPLPRTSREEVEADARAAIRCALAMAASVERLAASWELRGLPVGGLRIGLHTGPVVAGSAGSTSRLKYTSVGDTVNVAARLESLDRGGFSAEPGGRTRVLLSDATRSCVKETCSADPLGPLQLTGRGEAVFVWRLVVGKGRTEAP